MQHKQLLVFFLLNGAFKIACSTEQVIDFFAMSPAELASVPVSIASGTPTRLAQSASITSVITAEQIKSMGATELHEVMETIPGMHAGLQSSTGDYRYTVRGIQNTTNSELLFMLDGTRITTPFLGSLMTGTELSLEGVQRIEVIRGPGSALYGADAFAGVVNIITKKAKDIKGANLGARVGNWNTQSGWGQYATEFAGWNIAGSLQYQHTQGDPGRIIQADAQTVLDNKFGTQASHAPGAINSRYDAYNVHLKLERKHWNVGLWSFIANSGTRAGVSNALDPSGGGSGDQYLGDVKYSTEDWLENWELTSRFSYLYADFGAQFQAFPDKTTLPIGADGNVNFNKPVGLVNFPQGANAFTGRLSEVPTLELGSVYRGWKQHVWRINGSYRHEQVSTSFMTNIGTGAIDASTLKPSPNINVIPGNQTNLTDTPYVSTPSSHRTVWSGVVQDEWQISDTWQLTAGVRYDHYSDFGNTVNPRATLLWDINPKLTSKWLYGRAFRAPSFTELGNQNNPTRLGNRNLKPETIDTAEWALDFHPTSSLRLASNFFYYQLHDFIDLVPDVGKPSLSFKNSSRQEGYGTELEWNWQINQQLNLAGNYAWQHSYTNSTWHKISGVPEHHIYVAGIWKFLPQWQIQTQLNWIADRGRDYNDTRPLDDYQTVDFIVRGKKLFGQLNVSAVLKNAFDTHYVELANTQAPANIPMPGRSFYFEAAINF